MSHQKTICLAIALTLFILLIASCDTGREPVSTPMQELVDTPQPTAALLPTSTPILPTATNIPTIIPTNVEPLTRDIELIGHIGGEIPGFAVPTPDIYNAPGLAKDVIVEGKYAYVVQGADGPAGTEWGRLSVVDISTPSAPSLIGFYTPEVIATNIVVVNKVAYLTDGQCEFGMATCWGNLYILDISDPTSLVQVGVYGLNNMQSEFPTDRSWFASGVAVSGDYAYVTGGPYHSNSGEECGMSVVDISNAISPTIAGVIRCGDVAWGGQSITLQENYAYIAAGDEGLRIIDISNPSGPKEVSHIEGIGRIWDVKIMGSYAYLAADDSGLQIVDITNPSALNLTATFKTAGRALRVNIANGYAYIAASDAGLRVIDISDPNNPTEVAYYETAGYVYSVSVMNGYIYVADGKEGLLILQFG